MKHSIIYVIKKEDDVFMQEFIERLQCVEIQTRKINDTEKYTYYESSWDDVDIFKAPMKEHNPRNAGAKPKEIRYKDKPVSCGFIYLLRKQNHLSDAEIASLFDISESTISRRRRKHIENGNFYENSKVVF